MKVRSWAGSAMVAALLVVAAAPASAGVIEDAVAATAHTPDELVAAFDDAILPGLGLPGDPPPITGDPALDERIRTLAEARGYIARGEPTQSLVPADGYWLQPAAAEAWEALQAAAAGAGHTLILTSGYRSYDRQAGLFSSRITGTSDAELDAVLAIAAPAGYSRHHTGYAIDIRTPGKILHEFATTEAYAWLAADDWAAAKAFGFLPSYPDGSAPAGPDPEPWEFVWVGAINIICGDFEASPTEPFCDTIASAFAPDIVWLADSGVTTGCRLIRFCPDDTVTRAQAGTFLWRMAGEPASTIEIDFVDVPEGTFFTEAVRWMVEMEITSGTSPDHFSPHDPVTRDQFVTFLWRFAGEPVPTLAHDFLDVPDPYFASTAIRWASEVGITHGISPTEFSPGGTSTRGQTAAFLHRYDLLA